MIRLAFVLSANLAVLLFAGAALMALPDNPLAIVVWLLAYGGLTHWVNVRQVFPYL